jgi:hypothetical protein
MVRLISDQYLYVAPQHVGQSRVLLSHQNVLLSSYALPDHLLWCGYSTLKVLQNYFRINTKITECHIWFWDL